MILCQESALDAAIECTAGILPIRGKEFASGNQTVTAANQHHGAHIVDTDKPWRIDILVSGAEFVEG